MKVKVKVLSEFVDKYTGILYKEGKEYIITKERMEEILEVDNLVELVEEIKEEPKKEEPKEKPILKSALKKAKK